MVCDTPYLQNDLSDPRFFCVFNLISSFSTCSQSFKKICTRKLLGANVLKHLQIRNKAYVGLWFSTNPPGIRKFFLWIHQSLPPSSLSWFINPRGISTTRNMTSRLAIKFPIPYEWWSNELSPSRKRHQMPGECPEEDVEAFIWLVHYGSIGKC